MKKLNNESLNVTTDQLTKDANLKRYLQTPDAKKTPINIVDKNSNTATATNSTSPTTTTLGEGDMIEPQDQATLKYLSNLQDANGQVSQPFEINARKYQMVRAMQPDRQVVPAVYSLDEMDEQGQNKLYSVEEFDRSIATPARQMMENKPVPSEDPHFSKMAELSRNNETIDYLNTDDMAGSKHFFINKKTGEVIAKFGNTRDMIKSGIKLSEDEDYMDAKALRRHRLGKLLNNDEELDEAVNVGKLQQDVKKLSKLIKDKFVIALEKINTPLEQSQFLVAMAKEIGVPFSKLTSIINSFKDISKDQDTLSSMTSLDADSGIDTSSTTGAIAEGSRIITKNDLLESLKPISTRIKVKDIKNGRL